MKESKLEWITMEGLCGTVDIDSIRSDGTHGAVVSGIDGDRGDLAEYIVGLHNNALRERDDARNRNQRGPR
jgi:hypothetical protein